MSSLKSGGNPRRNEGERRKESEGRRRGLKTSSRKGRSQKNTAVA
jgi:hypothetical protein